LKESVESVQESEEKLQRELGESLTTSTTSSLVP